MFSQRVPGEIGAGVCDSRAPGVRVGDFVARELGVGDGVTRAVWDGLACGDGLCFCDGVGDLLGLALDDRLGGHVLW